MRGKLPNFMPDVPEVREDYTDYMGQILAWDAGVGVIVDRLRAIGELDNTLLVISGDHGMPGVPGGKCNLYDHGVGCLAGTAFGDAGHGFLRFSYVRSRSDLSTAMDRMETVIMAL